MVNFVAEARISEVVAELLRVRDGEEGGARFISPEALVDETIGRFVIDGGQVAGDEDFYLVTLEPDSRYRFEVNDAGAGGLDTVLSLFANPFQDPRVLMTSDDQVGLDPAIVYQTGPVTETLLVEVDTYLSAVTDVRGNAFGGAPAPIELGAEGIAPLTDTLIGGRGDDEVHGTEAGDILDGAQGDDLLEGFGGADTLTGRLGDDTILGGPGNDVIYYGPGRDFVDGGPGADTLHFHGLPDADDTVIFDPEDVILPAPFGDPFTSLLDPEDPDPFPLPEAFDFAGFTVDVATGDIRFDVTVDREGERGGVLFADLLGYSFEQEDFGAGVRFSLPDGIYSPSQGVGGIDDGIEPDTPVFTAVQETAGDIATFAIAPLNTGARDFAFSPAPEYRLDARELVVGTPPDAGDRVGGTPETALLNQASNVIEGTLETARDRDVYAVFLAAGETLEVTATGLGPDFTPEGLGTDPGIDFDILADGTLSSVLLTGTAPEATARITAAEAGFHFISMRDPLAEAFHTAYRLEASIADADTRPFGNRVPEIGADTADLAPGGEVLIPVLANDADPEGRALAILGVETDATAGRVSIEGGQIRYRTGDAFDSLAPGASATDSFRYAVTDGQGGSASAEVTVTVSSSAPPAAVADTAATRAGDAVDIPVTENDADPDGGGLSLISLGTAGLSGTAVVRAGGVVRYDPGTAFATLPDGATAIESFSYTVRDASGQTDTATVEVTVTGTATVGGPPVAADDARAVTAGGSLLIPVLANDDDPEGGALTLEAVSAAGLAGNAVIEGTAIRYATGTAFDGLAPGATATETFSYTVRDADGLTDTADVVVTVSGAGSPNRPPEARADAAVTGPGTPVTIAPLANDTDPDGDPLVLAALDTSGLAGTATLRADGTVVYDPAGAFAGLAPGASATDIFGYTVEDSSGAGTEGSVTVTVSRDPGQPRPPSAGDDAVRARPGETVTVEVLANDTDPDGDALTVAGVGAAGSGTTAVAAGGGAVRYTAPAGFAGSDGFTYTVADGSGLSDEGRVRVIAIKESAPGDDFPETAATPGALDPGGTLAGRLETGGDRDWAAVSLLPGRTYVLEQRGAESNGGTLPDPFLRLRDIDGREVANDDDGGRGFDAAIEFSAPAGGLFFLDAGSFDGSATGSYTMRLAEGLTVGEAQVVALLFEAVLDRDGQIATGGLNFHINARERGLSEERLAEQFLFSPEFEANFADPDTLSDRELVEILFRNVLDREGRESGIDFWTNAVGDPNFSRSKLLIEFATAEENVSQLPVVERLAEIETGEWGFV